MSSPHRARHVLGPSVARCIYCSTVPFPSALFQMCAFASSLSGVRMDLHWEGHMYLRSGVRIAGFALHILMKSQFDHLFMACLFVLHVPATFAPARGKLTSPPIPPPPAFAGRGITKREGGWMRWCMAPSHPLKYPLTHRIHSGIHSLTSGTCLKGGGGGLHALRGVRGVRGVATTGG